MGVVHGLYMKSIVMAKRLYKNGTKPDWSQLWGLSATNSQYGIGDNARLRLWPKEPRCQGLHSGTSPDTVRYISYERRFFSIIILVDSTKRLFYTAKTSNSKHTSITAVKQVKCFFITFNYFPISFFLLSQSLVRKFSWIRLTDRFKKGRME